MEVRDAKAGIIDGARRKLWRLILGRAAIALSLLLIGLAGAQATITSGIDETTPSFVIGLTVLLLSVCYALALRFSAVSLPVQAGTQFFLDVLWLTWLMGMQNNLHTPFVTLYILLIALAGIYLGPRGAPLTALGCVFSYTSVTLAGASGWLQVAGAPAFAGEQLSDTLTTVGLHDISFLVVGLLAARLSARQRRSDVELIEATHALANLRALHERIVESIRSGLITTDLQGRIYSFNAAAEEITGYKAEAMRGRDASLLFGDVREQMASALRSPGESHKNPRLEADCLTAEGFRLRLGYSLSPLYSERGETTGLIITFQDLTQVRALEETSRRQDRLAAVGRVAAGIAHEIRNPLAAMRGSIQVLHSDLSGDSAQAELMEIILRESDRINRIITDYLTYARPRPLALVETDVREPLRETFALLRNSPDIRDEHQLEVNVPDEPANALADASGLKQVFWNLARNSLHAMPQGGTLRAGIERTAPPGEHHNGGGRLRIVFTDTGCGMSPKQVERLFEPFTSSTTGGTGLGLSIVYQIIRDHGGTLNVRSREEQGTTITIELPESKKSESKQS